LLAVSLPTARAAALAKMRFKTATVLWMIFFLVTAVSMLTSNAQGQTTIISQTSSSSGGMTLVFTNISAYNHGIMGYQIEPKS